MLPTPDESNPQLSDAAAFAHVQMQLLARWPENRVAPDLGRISALMDLLGDPHTSAPVIHIAGTNGKTSTSRIIESLLRSFGLTTGLFTSPALESITERVQVNGKPVSPAMFTAAYNDIAPYLELLDQQSEANGGPPVTMFEAVTALGFACFADAPVDVMIIECGMGGTWDATNVVTPAVSVITPIGMDHMDFLGHDLEAIAGEKAGILSEGRPAVFARQEPEAAAVLMRTALELNVETAREGVEFAVLNRSVALGGQMLTIAGLGGEYDELYLPLHGEHQAANAALALAAVEVFMGALTPEGERRPLNIDTVRLGLMEATSPGRLERVRTSPTVLIDAAHNPHGARACAAAITESFSFSKVIAVVAVLEGKDVINMLRQFEPVVDTIIVTTNSSPRSLTPDDLAYEAISVFGDDRVMAAPNLPDALELAMAIADEPESMGSAGILATGSVVTAADVRRLLRPASDDIPDDASELAEPQERDRSEPDDDEWESGEDNWNRNN